MKTVSILNFISKNLFFGALIILTITSCQNKKESSKIAITADQTPKSWAEKLGYPAGKKVIMLHADDIGMCKEANIAAEAQMVNNQIQSAAIMMPCPNAQEFVQWAIDNPKMDVGLHLTLTSEWQKYRWGPVENADDVASLIDPDGKLWHEVPDVVAHASAEDVEKEIRAQIEKSIALGYRPDHIDTHMGTLFGHPSYIKAFFKVAQEYNIPANVIDISNPDMANLFKSKGYPMSDEIVQMANEYTLPKLDFFTSAPKADTYNEKIESFKQLIKSLPVGLTEIIFHPSVETDNLKSITGSWQQRVWEAKMFGDPELIKFFEDEEIIFTNWKEIMKRFNK
jgi:predicted glycoside hydrolase/deacetylase ChbG (UPF0249 family)